MIDPKKWEQIAEIFESAMALPQEGRTQFVEQACGDAEMADAVSRLIAADARAGEFLNQPVARVGDALEQPASSRVGTVLASRYRIVEEIARGGAGAVYLAWDTHQDDVPVVVKLLHEEARASRWLRRKFAGEAEALGRLDHPNIVRILDHGETPEGEQFLVMEYVRGVTLRAELKHGPLALARAAEIIRQAGAAVGYGHDHGIVHRDLKPENIMLVESGEAVNVKIIDFGIAQVRGGNSETETGMRFLAGTTRYMAPEQLLGEPERASDIYGLAVIAYETIAGFPPFSDQGAIEMLKQQGSGRVRDLRDVRRDVSAGAWKPIRRALSFNAEERPASAAEFASDLAVALARRPRFSRLTRSLHCRPRTLAAMVAAVAIVAIAFPILRPRRISPEGPPMTQLTWDSGITTEPAISGDGKILAYVSDRAGEGKLDLWLQPLRSRAAIRLTHRSTDVREPSFSPDGRTIAFVGEPDGGIYVTSVQGGPDRRVAEGPGHRPRFSPDGKWIAYWAGTEGGADPLALWASKIFVVPAAGGQWRDLAPFFAVAGYPVWSPDSKAILFAGRRDAGGDDQILHWMLVRPDDGLISDVTTRTDMSRHVPIEWLPNGHVIASSGYARSAPAEFVDVEISAEVGVSMSRPRYVDLRTSSEMGPLAARPGMMVSTMLTRKTGIEIIHRGHAEQIESDSSMHGFVDLSADGRQVVYDSTRSDGPARLNFQELRPGGETTRVALSNRVEWLTASSAGDSVYYQSAGRFFRAPLTGGAAASLCSTGARLWDVSPDRRYLLALSGDRMRQVAVMDLRSCGFLDPIYAKDMHLYMARFSPDGKWMLVEAKATPGRARLYIAPFRPGGNADPAAWIAVSDGKTFDGPGRWMPDGNSIVYLSKRDGFQCLWSQRLDAGKRAVGEPTAVWHLHSATQYINREFSVAQDKIAVILQQRAGNLWLSQ